MLDDIITLAIILRKDNIFFYYSLLFEYIFLSHQQNIFSTNQTTPTHKKNIRNTSIEALRISKQDECKFQ